MISVTKRNFYSYHICFITNNEDNIKELLLERKNTVKYWF